jgi:hypothetical protein
MKTHLPSQGCAWLLVWLLAPPAVAQSEQRTVQVRLEKETLPAGPGQELQVSILVKNSDGSPAPGLELRLDASRGALSPAQDLGEGAYRSTFRTPSETHPQAILIAAAAPGARPGYAVLRLIAKVDLPVRADKPRVKVTLLIGGRSYGPVTADGQGRVKIPIEVGPGETEAVAAGLDEFGNQTRKPVEIPIPPFPRLVGFAQRARLCADGKDATDIHLMAVEPDGSPAREFRLSAVRPAGKLSPAVHVAPGMVRLTYTAPDKLTTPRLTLKLGLKGEDKLSQREFGFDLAAGRPARIAVRAKPDRLLADGQASARLEFDLSDQAGNLLDGHALALNCAPGTAGPVQEQGRGLYLATYTAPLGLRGASAETTCQAFLVENSSVRSEFKLGLSAPVPARLELEASALGLPMDGRSQSRIDIRVLDDQGRGLPGVEVQARAPLGGLDVVSEDGQGRYHLTYTAPRGEESTRVRLEVTAGTPGGAQARGHLVLELEGIVPPPPPVAWLSLGPSAAYMTNFGRLDWAGASLQLDVKLPGVADMLYAGLEVGYRRGWWRGQLLGRASEGDAALDTDLFPVHLLVLFKPLPHAVASPVLGLGGGGHFVRWTLRQPDGAMERDQRALWACLAIAGLEIRLGGGALAVMARYLYSFLDARASEGGSRVHGSTGGLDVSLGYRVDFF